MAKDMKAMLARKIAENTARHAAADQEVELDLGKNFEKIPVDLIEPNPYQPRRIFPEDELASLAESIKESGLIQPISVRRAGGHYQIIAGERRWRAHQLLKLSHIEALIRPVTDDEMAVIALVENIDREDLSDYEIGRAIKNAEHTFPNRTKIAESLGKDRKEVYRYLAFFELPACVTDRLEGNPRLLGRAAAEKLKAFLQQHADYADLENILMEGWAELEKGRLEQSKLPVFIETAIRRESGANPGKAAETELRRSGKRVGGIKRGPRNLVVTLNTSAFNETQQTKLLAFIEQLVNEG